MPDQTPIGGTLKPVEDARTNLADFPGLRPVATPSIYPQFKQFPPLEDLPAVQPLLYSGDLESTFALTNNLYKAFKLSGFGADPAMAAQVQDAASRLGMSKEAVKINFKSAQDKMEFIRISEILFAKDDFGRLRYPATIAALLNPHVAAVAKNDVKQLTYLEHLYKERQRSVFVTGPREGVIDLQNMALSLLQMPTDPKGATYKTLEDWKWEPTPLEFDGVRGRAFKVLRTAPQLVLSLAAGGIAAKLAGPVLGTALNAFARIEAPVTAGLAAGKTVAAIGGASAASGALVTSSIYDNAIKQGMSPDKARKLAVGVGLAETMLEVVPMGQMFKLFRTSGAREVLAQSLRTGFAEFIEEYLQQYPEEFANVFSATAKLDLSTDEKIDLFLSRLDQAHIDGIDAGITAFYLSLLAGSAKTVVDFTQAINATRLEEFHKKIEEVIGKTDLSRISPETLRKFLVSFAQGKEDNIHIPSAVFKQYNQEQPQDYAELMRTLGLSEEQLNSLEKIPVSQEVYFAKLPKKFREIAAGKVGSDSTGGMSLEEANELLSDEELAARIEMSAGVAVERAIKRFFYPRAVQEFRLEIEKRLSLNERQSGAVASILMASAETFSQYAKEPVEAVVARLLPKLTQDTNKIKKLSPGERPPKGAYIPELNGVYVHPGATFDTILHEQIHIMMLEMGRLAELPDADPKLKEDWTALNTLTKGDHEALAELWLEHYYRKGEVPAPKLQGPFGLISRWLAKNYQFSNKYGLELEPETKAIFDRILASEKDIAEFENLLRDDGGLVSVLPFSEKERAKLIDLRLRARDKALSNLLADQLSSIYRRNKAKRKELEQRAKEYVASRKVYKIQDLIVQRHGLRLGELEQLEKETGVKIADKLVAKNARLVAKRGGASLAEIMALDAADYDSTYAMLGDIANSPSRRFAERSAVQTLLMREAESLAAEERFGEMKESAYFNDLQEQYAIAEYKALLSLAKTEGRLPMAKLKVAFYRNWAKSYVASLPIKEAVNPSKFSNELSKVGRKLDSLMAKNKMQRVFRVRKVLKKAEALAERETERLRGESEALVNEVLKLKEEMLRQHYLVRESIAAAKQFSKTKAGLKKLAAMNEDRMFGEHRDVIIYFLGEYGFTEKSVKRPDLLEKSLSRVITSLEKGAEPQPLPAILKQTPTNWEACSFQTVQELSDGLHTIAAAGSKIIRLARKGKEFIHADLKRQIVDRANEGKKRPAITKGGFLEKYRKSLREGLANTLFVEYLLKTVDNFSSLGPKGETGPAEKYIFRSMTKAYAQMYAAQTQLLNTKLKPLGQKFQAMVRRVNEERGIVFTHGMPELPDNLRKIGHTGWTVEMCFSALMNMGTETNRVRLFEGYGFSALSEMSGLVNGIFTEEELKSANDFWAILDGLFEELDATHVRMKGRHVSKETALPFTVVSKEGKVVELTGGYFPLKADAEATIQGKRLSEKDLLEYGTVASYQSAKLVDGFLKDRVGGKYAVALNISHFYRHVDNVLRYTYLAETVDGVNKLINDPEVITAITDRAGAENYEILNPWLQRIARPGTGTGDIIEKILSSGQRLAALYGLGLNLFSMLKQPLSLSSGVQEIGGKWVLMGLMEFCKHPAAMARQIDTMSSIMKMRGAAIEPEIAEQLKKIDPFSNKVSYLEKLGIPVPKDLKIGGVELNFRNLQDMMMSTIRLGDMFGAYPVWYGSYLKKLSEGNPENEAIDYADATVTDTQPISKEVYKNLWQSGGKGGKVAAGVKWALAPFTGWTMKFGSRARTYARAAAEGKISPSEFTRHFMLEWMAPPILTAMISVALKDDKLEDYGSLLAGEVASYWLSWIPLVNLVPTLVRYPNVGTVGQLPAVVPVTLASRALLTGGKALQGDKTFGDVFMAFGETAEWALGIPAIKFYKRGMKIYDATVGGK